jgi:HPt (histidine-containing phosphotransfer) domain-containing protein
MDDYISKPLNEEQLYSLISKHARSENADATLPVIDIKYLRSLSKGDIDFEKKMIRTFAEEIPGEIEKLKNAIDKKDYDSIRSLAHHMRSTVGYLGLDKLSEPLGQIEMDAESKDGMAGIQDNFYLINHTCKLALKEAEKIIS